MKKLISIICPAYNEEKNIPIFYKRLQAAFEPLRGRYELELIFTNNRSEDGTLDAIKEIYKSDPSIQYLTMSRNFGYQASVQAGMKLASGDGVMIIDADCEDPPELLSKFVEKWEEGYDIVYGVRGDRPMLRLEKESRDFFYRLLRKCADMDIVLYMAEFALLSRHVKEAILCNNNTFPFLRAEIGHAGFSRYGIHYDRESRPFGKSNYNIVGMFAFAIAGLLTSSTFLFRLAAYLLPVLAALNIFLLGFDIMGAGDTAFKLLVAIDLFYLISLITIYGVYLARIYKNQIGRPVFIIDPNKSSLHSGSDAMKVSSSQSYPR